MGSVLQGAGYSRTEVRTLLEKLEQNKTSSEYERERAEHLKAQGLEWMLNV